MKALISPAQDNLVVEVKNSNNIFEVALPLFWADCPTSITAYDYKYKNNQYINFIPTPAIPNLVSMRQARLALLQNGLLDDVETSIQQGAREDKITWEYATEVNRTDTLVTNMAIALGLSKAQLDELFILAAAL